jgi:intein-encoded DNA endonuclease-like protein
VRKQQLTISKSQLIYLQTVHHTDLKIAKILNTSPSRICQIRKIYNIPVYPIKKSKRIRDRFVYRTFKENKISKKDLAKNNKLSYKTILRIINSFQKEEGQ